MINVLVIAEHDETRLAPGTGVAIAAASALSPDCIDLAVLADDGKQIAADGAGIAGVSRVLLIERSENAPCLAAVWAPQLAELAADYTHVFAPATTFGKDLLPRVAALLGVGALSDITAVDGPHRFERPVYAGNAVVTIDCDPDCTLVATVRPTAFETPAAQTAVPIETRSLSAALPTHTRFIERRGAALAGPDLQTAARVVAGGRGLAGEDGVELVIQLAATLGAAVGASRAAVDSGWMANDLQVGQTGKIIAPQLYIGIGISGAIQHLTGIKESGTIVAINKDAEAPLSSLADIVLIADLFTAVPELIAGLKARQSQ